MTRTQVGARASGALALLLALSPLAVPATASASTGPPGTLLSTGSNGFGQLGVGGTAQRLQAGPVNGVADVVQMHSGREHGVARTQSGDVYTWGSNQRGQLGLGGGGNRNQATRVPGLSDVQAVSTGHYHTLALDSDGSVWTWGYNANGQLGDGTTSRRNSPVEVSGLGGVVSVAAGRDMSYAVTATGQVFAWGMNDRGQLGDGTTTQRTTPVQVSGLTQVTQVAGGRDHGLARRSDGSVWAWGWNRYGQLGNGSTTNRTTPVRVVDAGIAQVIAGAHHSYALRNNGTVASWGRGYRGALGNGATGLRTNPVTVTGVSDAVAVGSGRDHGLAVLSDGRVRVWGNNPSGQLGDGTTTRRLTPVWMLGVTDAVDASGGQAHSFVHVSEASGPPPPNQPPEAVLDVTCDGLSCQGDGSASQDDGGIDTYDWDFGEGGPYSGPVATHTYSTEGTYTVELTVTDEEGLEDSASMQVTVSEPPPPGPSDVTFRAGSQSNFNRSTPSVGIPGSVQSGDSVLLVVSTSRDVTASTPNGWTLEGTRSDSELQSHVFSRVATAATGGSTVQVSLSARSKASMVVAAYDGVTDIDPVLSAIRSGRGTSMSTPPTDLGSDDAWVVSYWVDKTGSNSGWSVPAATRLRVTSMGQGNGRVTAALADSGPISGPWPGATATSTASSGKSVAWTLVLR